MTPARDDHRIDAIDFLKAAAIVAVVATHSGVNIFYPMSTAWDRALTSTWTWYHVPAFLLVSGFLYQSERPASLRDVARRLARVWIPYVLACLFMLAVGAARVDGVRQALFQIASASILGPYYYIAQITGCMLTLWPLSRLEQRGAALLLAALLAYAVALVHWPALHIPASALWMGRNPLESFVLGYFVLGWVIAQHRAWLTLRLSAHRLLIGCIAAAVAYTWIAGLGLTPNPDITSLHRVLYTLSVVALILIATRGRRAPPVVRFLSTASLAIYLYHLAPVVATSVWINRWPPPLRIAFEFLLGIGFASLLAIVGRRVLGAERARRFLGA